MTGTTDYENGFKCGLFAKGPGGRFESWTHALYLKIAELEAIIEEQRLKIEELEKALELAKLQRRQRYG